jgi:hypothetical protein
LACDKAGIHKLAPFSCIEESSGEAVLNGARTPIQAAFAVLPPAEVCHNIVTSGIVPLKRYTLHAPPIIAMASSIMSRADVAGDVNTSTFNPLNRPLVGCANSRY